MASATVTARPEAARRARAGRVIARRTFRMSRIGQLLLGLNMLGLAILIVGALLFNEFRRGLIEARLDSLNVQADAIARLLDQGATVGEPTPTLDADRAVDLLQLLSLAPPQRARLFDAQGRLIADSYVIGDHIEQHALPPPPKPGQLHLLWRKPPSQADAPALERSRRELQNEVAKALHGHSVADIRVADDGGKRVSVSAPIQHVEAVLGVVTLEAGDVDATVWAQRRALFPFILIAVGVTLTSSLLANVLVATPLERLQRAANSVRLNRARAISMPDLAERHDEIGGLTRALESMTDAQSARMDAIERFAADVAHEIKNPLTSIRSAVETLELAPPTSPHRDRLIGILKQDVRRLDRLITDIANASRLDAELSRDAPRAVDLHRLLADMTELYSPERGVSGPPVRLSATAAGDAFLVAGREGPLGQVFRNLIENARSFSPPDGVVRVVLAHGPEGESVVAAVEDGGPGLPPENLETVFERFYTNRPKGSAPGGSAFGGHSGLGLSIARQIVEAHGGAIRAENRVDDEGRVLGARFVASFPEARR